MRTLNRVLLASSAAAVLAIAPATARAQNDVTPHLPDVLLLLDTSGSMDYLIPPNPSDGVTPMLPGDPNAPGSACALNGTTTMMTRWATLVSVLTGSFQPGAFGCETLQRIEPKFVTEFSLPTLAPNTTPYDLNYYIPWHRIYSNGCTLGAGFVNNPQDWTNWGATPFNLHNQGGQCLNGVSPGNLTNCCAAWSGQNGDGLLDAFSGMVRFGMMSFDSLPDASTGATVGVPSYVNGAGAMKGTWSYFHNWQNSSPPAVPGGMGQTYRPAAGEPAGCATPRYMEVGARNPSAPPWEGPLTAFGDPMSDTQIGQVNTQIQNQILAMRPYGATPIAGMLDDAREFLFTDTENAPGANPVRPMSPYTDPYWQGGCRKMYMILLTDGFPNMDLRGVSGQCDAAPNNPALTCPYDTPENILTQLRMSPPGGNMNQSVTTFVVGFALSTPASLPAGKTSCSQLQPTDCISPSPGLQACCKLQSLALAGGGPTATAFFADNPGQLKQVLASILSQIIGSTTARTSPVYSAAGSALAQGPQFQAVPALSYHFAASFNVTSSSTETNFAAGGGTTGLWSGNLVRERYVCSSGLPTPQTVAPNMGDDYAANLNSHDAAHPRQFLTVIGNTVAAGGEPVTYSDRTMRPFVTIDDGFGVYQPLAATPGLTPTNTFPTVMSGYPTAFGIQTASADPNCKNAFGLTTNQPNTCTQMLVNWEIGGTNALPPALSPAPSRDTGSPYCVENPARQCSLLGAIYHSTPVVVGPPREFLRDDTYTSYANTTVPHIADQPSMLYTATIDGQLHAFKVSATATTNSAFTTDTLANNELWSFIPPAVLQHIMPNYNSGGSNLLDGSPVVADVPGQTTYGFTPPLFERTVTSSPIWHRVLVASGGRAGGFYYALDVTDPTNPQFLWQISTDANGNHMFGATTPTPAIAIVALQENGVTTQVPIAILPGGSSTLLSSCAPQPALPASLQGTIDVNDGHQRNPSNTAGSVFNMAKNPPPLRCWQTYNPNNPNVIPNNGNYSTGNSVTIVRLDSGKILAHITGAGYYGAVGGGTPGDPGTPTTGGATGNIFTTRPFPAPMTGMPVAYPADTGQVADRIYIGDANGQLWRIDLTGQTAASWATFAVASPGITLSWDAYMDQPTANREVVELPPVLSRDPIGNMTIMFATGDQDLLTSQSNDNRVWSLTEEPLNFYTSQNWYIKFIPGAARVVGPMALFNDVLYFSTYTPASPGGSVCQDGYPSLYAVDDRRPNPQLQPYMGFPLWEYGSPPTNYKLDGPTNGSVIYGVSATETPSCGGSVNTSDAYFGSHSAVSGVAQSEYRIMWQTGAGAGLPTGGAVRNETNVKGMQNMTIPSPGLSTRIDSWAAIVE